MAFAVFWCFAFADLFAEFSVFNAAFEGRFI